MPLERFSQTPVAQGLVNIWGPVVLIQVPHRSGRDIQFKRYMRYSKHPQMGHLWRGTTSFSKSTTQLWSRPYYQGQSRTSSHDVEMDRHASSAARFHLFVSWLASAQNSLADAASHFEYGRLFAWPHPCREALHAAPQLRYQHMLTCPPGCIFLCTASLPRPDRPIGQDRILYRLHHTISQFRNSDGSILQHPRPCSNGRLAGGSVGFTQTIKS